MSRILFAAPAALVLLIFALPFGAGAQEKTRRSPAADKDQRAAESEWVRATGEYQRSLEKMRALYRREFQEKAARVGQLRDFYGKNLIARVELEESQRALSELETKIEDVERKLIEADLALGTARGPKGPGVSPETPILIHYDGRIPWSPAGIAKVEKFFRVRFGRVLPVSASGQTDIHSRMRLDHRYAVDVAVHPDSPEGQVLIAYLRGEGIPFVAFRSPMAGSATGAHIHIGRPSVRLSAGRQ